MAANAVSLAPERIAAVLGVPTHDVEDALVAVGVDADYLARALLEGDPQEVLPAVAGKLHLQKPDLVIALVKALVRDNDAPDRVAHLLDAALYHLADPDALRVRGVLAQESRPRSLGPTPRTRDEDEILHALLNERIPRFMRRAALGAAVGGTTLAAFGTLGFFAPALFKTALLYLAATLLTLGGTGLLYLAYRIYRNTIEAHEAKPRPRAP